MPERGDRGPDALPLVAGGDEDGRSCTSCARDGRSGAEPLTGEVEVDEGFLGGRDTDLRGGRQRHGKPLVGVAVEVRGDGSGRLRLQLLPDASSASLTRIRLF